MMRSMSNGRPKAKTRVVTFKPCGPVSAMLDNHTRGKGWGAMSRVLEAAIVEHLGPRYPKLRTRFNVLRDEANGNDHGRRAA